MDIIIKYRGHNLYLELGGIKKGAGVVDSESVCSRYAISRGGGLHNMDF